jgi:hypothetical protein
MLSGRQVGAVGLVPGLWQREVSSFEIEVLTECSLYQRRHHRVEIIRSAYCCAPTSCISQQLLLCFGVGSSQVAKACLCERQGFDYALAVEGLSVIFLSDFATVLLAESDGAIKV